MNVSAKLDAPNETNVTMSITMTYAEWMRLHSRLVGPGELNYVCDDLARQVRTVLGKVAQTFNSADLTQQ